MTTKKASKKKAKPAPAVALPFDCSICGARVKTSARVGKAPGTCVNH